MFIDYIYLSLIILKIFFIIFLIYLSYEYRNIECFDLYVNPLLNIKENIIKANNLKDINFNDKYRNINDEINKKNIIKNNNKNIELYKKTQINLSNSNKLKELNRNLTTNTNNSYSMDKLIKTIKSKYNAQYLSTFSNDIENYGILVNDKCLTVNGLCKDEFCLLNCQNNLYTSDSQKFNTKRITNSREASSEMNVNIDKITKKNVYPYNIFKSLVNDNCLTLSNDGITVEKCNLNNIKQQWEISPDENLCVLE